MSPFDQLPFREVWLVDFEFRALPGERPVPICLVAREAKSGRELRVWEDRLRTLSCAPYALADDSLIVAYYASAEVGCHLALDWNPPANLLDLYVEFRNLTNGLDVPAGRGLLGALAWFGLDGIDGSEKDSMRDLAIRGGPWTESERSALLDYCAADVDALARLLSAMTPELDLPRALLRGRYMRAAASIEWNGVPLDVEWQSRLRHNWEAIRSGLIARVDRNFGVYKGTSFSSERFGGFLEAHEIPWPRTERGQLALDDDTFRQMAKSFPTVAPLRELRHALSELRLNDLQVGSDGRNRTLLSAFGGKTGRNQPSNTKFIFGPAVWLRCLIRPESETALAYLDWSQQEFGIAAALSRDRVMMEAYCSGDPYLAFAKQARAVPSNATKSSHKAAREQFKQCALAVQYGMGSLGLAQRIGQPLARGEQLLSLHKRTYPRYWSWSDAAVDRAMLYGELHTVFGWRIRTGASANPRSLRNFPMQANGAEMLRLACCLAVERGLTVCAPIHDALLIQMPIDQISEAVALGQEAMSDASAVILDGFRLRSDVKVVQSPERYVDDRGREMWDAVTAIARECEGGSELGT